MVAGRKAMGRRMRWLVTLYLQFYCCCCFVSLLLFLFSSVQEQDPGNPTTPRQDGSSSPVDKPRNLSQTCPEVILHLVKLTASAKHYSHSSVPETRDPKVSKIGSLPWTDGVCGTGVGQARCPIQDRRYRCQNGVAIRFDLATAP